MREIWHFRQELTMAGSRGQVIHAVPGLDPGIHQPSKKSLRRRWIAGSSPAMTGGTSKGFQYVRTAPDRSRDLSQGDPARLHRTAAGVIERARRQRASDLETDGAGTERFRDGADAHHY